PRPPTDAVQTLVVDRDNDRGTRRPDRAGKPQRKVVSERVELREVVEITEEQQNRRSRQNARGQDNHESKRRAQYTDSRRARSIRELIGAYYTMSTVCHAGGRWAPLLWWLHSR